MAPPSNFRMKRSLPVVLKTVMAERELSERFSAVQLTSERDEEEDHEAFEKRDDTTLCCICQEPCVNPVQLPCKHIFCFLCIKGVAARSSHCALCRYRIQPGFLDNPLVVNKSEMKSRLYRSGDCYNWCYEARNGGWWIYEQRTSIEIENAYKEDKQSVRLQVSGFYYIIDLKEMIQYREDFPNRRRRIMREKVSAEIVKGVAGIVVEGTEGDDHGQNATKGVAGIVVEETEGDDHGQNATKGVAGIVVEGTERDDSGQNATKGVAENVVEGTELERDDPGQKGAHGRGIVTEGITRDEKENSDE